MQKSINRGIILIDRLITNVLAKVLQNVFQVIIQYVGNKSLDGSLQSGVPRGCNLDIEL